MTEPTWCIICGRAASEHHHIIPKGHIGGKRAEDWSLNLAPLCKACHQRRHVEGGEPEELWARMPYRLGDIMVMAALGAHPSATRYPLVRRRAEWARGLLDPQVLADLDYLLPMIEVAGARAFRALARFTGEKPPGWI